MNSLTNEIKGLFKDQMNKLEIFLDKKNISTEKNFHKSQLPEILVLQNSIASSYNKYGALIKLVLVQRW